MNAKFIKQDGQWLVAIVSETSGTKAPQVGDIVGIKLSSGGKRNVVLTEIVATSGTPEVYGYRTVAAFTNH